jgi:hypothetical protein
MIPTVPFDKLQISEQFRSRKPNHKKYTVNGLDTETDGKANHGYALMIANQESWTTLKSIRDVFKFLKQKKHQNALNFFYNLRYDVEVMFKYDLDIFISFMDSDNDIQIDYSLDGIDYKITYIPSKLLVIQWFHKTVKFYDIAQFFKKSLGDASAQYLSLSTHNLKEQRHDLYVPELNDYDRAEYCMSDAMLTKLLAEWYLKQLHRLSFFPSSLISPGNLSAQYLLKNTSIPRVKHVPTSVLEPYFYSFRGGWFDIYKRGTIKTHKYDINSAYPKAFYDLPDVRDGRWVNEFRSDSKLGIVKVIINSSPSSFLPLGLPTKTGGRVYPTIDNPITAYLTKTEFEVLEKPYSLDLIDSYTFVETPLPRRPFRDVIDNLYRMKSENKHDPGIYTSTKEIINSIYGKSIESRKIPNTDKYITGNLWNPVYASECTAYCRMQIYTSFQKYAKNIISLATDGIATTKPVKHLPISNVLGEWDYEGFSKTTYIMSGINCDDRGKSKSRGLKKIPDMRKALDTSASSITVNVQRPTHFREALIQDRPQDIGTFQNHPRTLTARGDLKRMWLKEPDSMRDLLHNVYDSVPLSNIIEVG